MAPATILIMPFDAGEAQPGPLPYPITLKVRGGDDSIISDPRMVP